VHHVENDLPEVLAASYAPFLENRKGHRAELFQREGPDPAQQFLPGDMPDVLGAPLAPSLARLAFAGFAADLLCRVVECLPHEHVSLPLVPRILEDDFVQGFVEACCIHSETRETIAVAVDRGGCAARQAFTAHPINNRSRTAQRNCCCCRVRLNMA